MMPALTLVASKPMATAIRLSSPGPEAGLGRGHRGCGNLVQPAAEWNGRVVLCEIARP